MKYAHITVDVGAAEKYFKVIWNNPVEFKDFIIQVGDYHVLTPFLVTVENLLLTIQRPNRATLKILKEFEEY